TVVGGFSTTSFSMSSGDTAKFKEGQTIYVSSTTYCTYQQTTVVCVADVSGSLNNTYFYISAIDVTTMAEKDLYVWFNINGGGTDPGIVGRTGIQVAAATNSSATVIGAAIVSAISADTFDLTSVNNSGTVSVSGTQFGPVPNASDVSTGFTITTPVTGLYGKSPEVTITNISGTVFTVGTSLGYIPAAGYIVNGGGFNDGSSFYRFI